MEAGGKDRPPMLAPGNYVQWKSRIKIYIDTKPNHELIHYCLQNPPYEYKWTDKAVLVVEGSTETTTKRNQCDVTNHQVNVQFLLQLQPEWQRSQQAATRNRGKVIVNSPPPIYDQEPTMVVEDDEISNHDNSPRINRGTGYDNQRIVNVVGVRENVEQDDWRDDTDDEPNDQELEAHYMYMAQIQEVTPDAANNSGPIFDSEPLQKGDQDDDDDLANERNLLASLIEKLKCEIDDSKNRNKFLETSNKALVDKMKDLKKFQAELDRYHDVKYASKVEIDCAKAKGDLMSYKMIKFYKTREDKEIDKVIALENKVKVLDNIAYKTDQSVQTMNMLNHNCKTSFAKPEFLKKAQRVNPRLLDLFIEIPSGEIKVHIEVLLVLWGNKLPILDRSLPLSSLLKGRGSPGRNKTPGPWSARIPMWQLFKGLRGSMLNIKASIQAMATLPLVTSLVSVMLEHESGVPADFISGPNLRTIGISERFVIYLDSSHHSSTHAFEAKADSVIRSVVVPLVMTEAVITSIVVNAPPVSVPKSITKSPSPVHASMFHDSDSTRTVKADTAGPFYFAKQDLSMGSHDYDVSRKFVDHLAPPALFSQICEMDYHRLFMEFNVGTARQACLNAEARDEEVKNLKSQLLLKKNEAAEASHFRAQVSAAKATEKIHINEIDSLKQKNVALENEKESLDGKVAKLQAYVSTKDLELKDLNIEEFQDAQINIVNDKVAKLDADLLKMALHLEDKFYPHLLTTISGRRLLLTHGIQLAIIKCLNSQKYLSALGAAISRAIEKGMQDGLSAGIDHGKADIMNLLELEGPLADALGMSDLQPHADQLMLYVHRSKNQAVLGETSLSFYLSVTHSRAERIRENVAVKRSALIGVWTPLVYPLSTENLVGEAGTSYNVPTIAATTTALSTTFASTSFIHPITIEDYEIIGADGLEDAQGSGQGNVVSFPIVEFEKEDLDTTPEHDSPS
uniref:Uncharacterized protein n=1 Tax=Tanacetum cinerariifolium TaxID=118510 RepID=A0A6L2N4V3_TANCI|nr:hypothetical protein [Tanacetum cinerariifolium]